MKNVKFLSLIILAITVLYSCAKYDEGSNFTLLTAKARMVNTWTMTKYEVNGSDETSNTPGLEVVFSKDNSFKRTFNVGFLVSDTGTWGFLNTKASISLVKSDGSSEIYDIIQLKNKHLKVKRTDSSTYTYTFKGK